MNTLITGSRASGKTYRLVEHAVENIEKHPIVLVAHVPARDEVIRKMTDMLMNKGWGRQKAIETSRQSVFLARDSSSLRSRFMSRTTPVYIDDLSAILRILFGASGDIFATDQGPCEFINLSANVRDNPYLSHE